MEKCHAIEAELSKSQKKKLEIQNDKHQSSNLLYQKKTEIEQTNNEINSITKAMIHTITLMISLFWYRELIYKDTS